MPRTPGHRESALAECAARVAARFRPPASHDNTRAFRAATDGKGIDSTDGAYHFDLDRAFPEGSTQEAVFDDVGRPIVDALLAG